MINNINTNIKCACGAALFHIYERTNPNRFVIRFKCKSTIRLTPKTRNISSYSATCITFLKEEPENNTDEKYIQYFKDRYKNWAPDTMSEY